MDGQMCWMKEARVVRIIGERRIGPLCRRVAIGVFASIQKTTPTCHCFHCHMRRSRWSWVSPGGTRVSQSPTVSWTVVSLVRWYARSRGHCQFISCSFVSTIADSVACSILATVLSLYSDYQLPLVSIIFKLLLYALFSIRVTRLSPPSLSVIESSGLIGRAGKSSGRVTKIASCSSIYRVCADIVGESLSFPRRER